MRRHICFGLVAFTSLTCLSLAQVATDVQETPVHQESDVLPGSAQLFEGMGSHQRAISTTSAEAQQYFDQGLVWAFAFNHDEAIRSFLRAAELDPQCAMAWWGVAYCEGPNYNDDVMTEPRSKAAWYALQNALARIDHAKPVERDLVEALAQRYANPWPEDRAHLEQAYADAMGKIWQEYPHDTDVGMLYAESLMVRRPWKLYTLDQEPVEDTDTIVAVLSDVLKLDPNHPGANHLLIHAVEPSANPAAGLAAARRLSDLVPASGHLLHMPSHIYVKTGFWQAAISQNEKSLAADQRYRELSPKQGVQYLYMVHNAHMLAYASMMSGREQQAMTAARAMWTNIPEAALQEVGPIFDLWMCSVYDVEKRFGRWEAILAEDAPPDYLPITTAIWRAHRAIAYAAQKDFDNAKHEYEAFRRAKAALPEDQMSFIDLAHTILDVSDHFIAGELALQKQDWNAAEESLKRAIEIEDSLNYGEPPQWLQPVRHTLGAVYLKAKRFQDAERVYREDLEKWPNNGWSLFGLSRALEQQGKSDEAQAIKQEFEQAWAGADSPLDTSCKCLPKT